MKATMSLEGKTSNPLIRRIGRMTSGVCVAALLLGFATTVPADAQVYSITDLGTLSGGAWSQAYALNDTNHVTGAARNSANHAHAFLYDGGMQDLGTLGGYLYSAGNSINDSGEVVGYAQNSAGIWRAFLYSGGIMQGLGTLGGTNSYAASINNAGQIAGWSDTKTTRHAFLYNGGVMQDLSALLGSDLNEATGINTAGQVVGWARTINGNDHAFLWDSNLGTKDLGILPGGTYSNAQAVNDSSQVVGLADISGGSVRAFRWSAGVMTNLGTLPNFSLSGAYGINKYDRVVGFAFNPNLTSRAFVWDSFHGLRDLNSLIPSGSGWVLREAHGINSNGDIVGWGTLSGQVRGFLLKPNLLLSTVNISQYVAYDPFWYLKDPAGPVEEAHIINTSKVTLTGPFQVMITKLPAGRTLANAHGAYNDIPYITLSVRSLVPGASVDVKLKFNASIDGQVPTHGVQVYSGDL